MASNEAPELTAEQKAELFIPGVEALGLDFDEEGARIEALPTPFERFMAISEIQVAAMSARMDMLPGAQGGE